MKCPNCNYQNVPGALFCANCRTKLKKIDKNIYLRECKVLHSYSIGRASNNDIIISDSSVSRKHAALEKLSDGTWFIKDLDSKNGIKVNGEHILQKHIQNNSKIQLGYYKISGIDLINKAKKCEQNISISNSYDDVSKSFKYKQNNNPKTLLFVTISILLILIILYNKDLLLDSNHTNKTYHTENYENNIITSKEIERATVIILAQKGKRLNQGTGFFVSKNYIITNHHVVDGTSQIIYFNETLREPYRAKVYSISKQLDLAILITAFSHNIKSLPLGEEPKRGDDVTSWGYPGFVMGVEEFPKVIMTAGKVNSDSFGTDPSYIMHSSNIAQGNSGGPLLNKNNEVVGVNTFVQPDKKTNSQFNYAVSVIDLKKFLKKNGI